MTMHIYKEGDTSRAICGTCKKIQATTMQVRDVPTDRDPSDIVRDVMVGVCDGCNEIVSMPHQSAPRLGAHLRDSRRSLDTAVPQHLLDGVYMALSILGYGTQSLAPAVRLYLTRTPPRDRLQKMLESVELQGKATARFSTKVSAKLATLMQDVEKDVGANRSAQVRVAMLRMKQGIVDNKDEQETRYLLEHLAAL